MLGRESLRWKVDNSAHAPLPLHGEIMFVTGHRRSSFVLAVEPESEVFVEFSDHLLRNEMIDH